MIPLTWKTKRIIGLLSYLVLPILGQKPMIGRGADGEEMRGQGAHDLTLIFRHDIQAVEVKHAVGVHGDEDAP